MNRIAVIGGTGLYELEGMTIEAVEEVATPFGSPSSPVTRGRIGEAEVLFLARHGVDHTLLPSEINYRANIFALKKLGATWCISVSAVGSLAEEVHPGHVVIPDQLIDRTVQRQGTFFGHGIVAHIPFATPFCPVLREALVTTGEAIAHASGSRLHNGGTFVCMEGPAFSTRAESMLYRRWGARIVGMTAIPEAKLAREAELGYATIALVTDYDCWRTVDSDVSVAEIMETFRKNIALAKLILQNVIPRLATQNPSPLASRALESAILTDHAKIPAPLKEELRPLIGKYLS